MLLALRNNGVASGRLRRSGGSCRRVSSLAPKRTLFFEPTHRSKRGAEMDESDLDVRKWHFRDEVARLVSVRYQGDTGHGSAQRSCRRLLRVLGHLPLKEEATGLGGG